MRNNFNSQLDLLHDLLKKMGLQCVNCINYSTQALLLGDSNLGEKAIEAEKETDILEEDIKTLCMRLMIGQNPVASDFRMISSAFKVITDMERIADQGSDIAYLIKQTSVLFEGFSAHISGLSECIIKMVNQAVDSFAEVDAEKAKAVIKMDDDADELFHQIKKDIIDMMTGIKPQDKEGAEKALNSVMIAKYLERIGDHAVNIAEYTLMAAGEIKE